MPRLPPTADRKQMPHNLELLAPAGDWAALQAAIDAGADAIYLGLRTLNARRRAKNFSPAEFVKAVETAHAKGAKVYLTLNIDLAQRELGQAARILQLARQSQADAVLIRDPALLALRSEYPELEFHMSTQTCMANSADLAAAAELGAQRAVLAREMTLPEITAASSVPNIKTEVFVQGALCFSVSGRCLLSSWAGGRSGNRGACTSPCRVPWSTEKGTGSERSEVPVPLFSSPKVEKGTGSFFSDSPEDAMQKRCLPPFPPDTPLSMKDLSLIDRLPELRQTGVSALKIEGRLKNAAWVGRAVSLFKRALTKIKGTGSERSEVPVPFLSTGSERSEVPVPFLSTGSEGACPLFSHEAEQLGLYTGRSMTSAYLDAQRDNLTAQAQGRQPLTEVPEEFSNSSPLPLGEGQLNSSPLRAPTEGWSGEGQGEGNADLSPLPLGEGQGEGIENLSPLRAPTEGWSGEGQGEGNADLSPLRAPTEGWSGEGQGEGEHEPTYDLQIMIEPKHIACSCICGTRTEKWTIPKTVIRRPHKAVAVGALLDQLDQGTLNGFQLGRSETNDPDFLLTPRAANALVDRILKTIRLAQKSPDEPLRIDLPPAVSDLLQKKGTQLFSRVNHLHLGDKPNWARLDAKDLTAFLRDRKKGTGSERSEVPVPFFPKGIIVENLSAGTLGRIHAMCENIELVAALPQVFFEDDIPHIKKLLAACADQSITVEVNSWGGWHLAKAADVKINSGPGLPVLNCLAAQFLAEKGIACVTLSPEADRRQLEDLSAHCPLPSALVVFGRPPLITTRVEVPERFLNQVLIDRRNIKIIPRREHGLCIFRPADPFDLRALKNDRIRVNRLIVDLIGSDNPIADWQNLPLPDDATFHFNYDRTLS